VAHAKRTVVDLTARRDENKIAFVVEHFRESPSRIIEKVYYLDKMTKTVDIRENYIVAERKETIKDLRKEGYKPLTIKQFINMVLNNERARSKEKEK
jgi:hypothetical protein